MTRRPVSQRLTGLLYAETGESESRYDSAFVLVVDEILDFLAVQDLHECLDLGAVLVALAYGNDVDVRARAILDEEGILRRVELDLHREVGVDDGSVDIVERARNLCGFDFLELEVLRVLGDILQRGFLVDAILELQQAGLLEKEQCTAAIGRVVRDGDRSALFEVLEVFDLLGVDAHRLDVDAAGADELDFLVLFHEVLEIRVMLEEVGIEFLVVEGEVRLDVVVEFDDFDSNALFSCFFSDFFHDFGMGAGRDADFDFFLVTGGSGIAGGTAAGDSQAGRGDEEGSKDFFYSYLHVNHILSEGEMEVVGQKEKPSYR